MNQNPFEKMRTTAGIKQTAVASALGINRSTVSKWETGKAFPRGDKLPVLAKILKCSINDFYSTEENEADMGHDPIPSDPVQSAPSHFWPSAPDKDTVLAAMRKHRQERNEAAE